MKYILSIASALLLLTGLCGFGQDPRRGDDIREAMSIYGQAEVSIAYPGFNAMTEYASRFSVSSCNGKYARLTLSSLTAEDFIRTALPYSLILPEATKSVYTASSADEAMLWQSYPTWKHYDTIMHRLAAQWPEVCILDTIGLSIGGRAVMALKISDNASSDEEEPAVMLSAAIHGDELAGFILLMRLAEYLASESSKGGMPGELVSGLEIWINPLANPDGMYRDNDTILFPIRVNRAGYDLNRNFPDPENPTSPVVQKETLDMMKFMEEKRFVLSANLHSGEEVINYPWDKWTREHADDEWFNDISRRYADTVHLHAEPGYLTFLDNGVTRGSVWYVIRGGRQDYITWGLQGREVTMELDKTKQTPATDLENLWNWNSRSLLRYLGEALYGVKGKVTDKATGEPLAAKLFIAGYDIDSSHVYSDTLSGEFYRFLSPGIYTLTFSSPGYVSKSTDITIGDWTSSVSVDIQLEEISSVYPSPPASGLLIYPNPASGEFGILPPTGHAGEATVTISGLSGQVIDTRHVVTLPGIPEFIDCSHFPPGIYIISYNKVSSGTVLRGKVVIQPFISR